MLHELSQFASHHWLLVTAFVVALILLFIEEAKSQGGAGQLSPSRLTHMMNRDNAIIIDTREKDAYQKGHIIGAKNIAAKVIESDEKSLDSYRDQPIVLIDASGTKVSALSARLKKSGFDNIQVLKGGMAAWHSADMPVVKEKKAKGKKKGGSNG